MADIEKVECYKFVSGLDRSYSSSLRAHVLRQHIFRRKKNAADRLSYRSRTASHCPTARAQAQAQDRKESQAQENQGQHIEQETGNPTAAPFSRNSLTSSSDSSIIDQPQQAQSLCGRDQRKPRFKIQKKYIPSMVGILGLDRVDPFSTFAKIPTPREDFLIRYYLSDVLAYFAAPGCLVIHPPRDMCFRTNIQDQASMYAMYAYTAQHLATRYGLLQDEAWSYRAACVHAINEALSDPARRFADMTIMAVSGLITSEREKSPADRCRQEEVESWTHVQGLRQIIMARGGFPAIATNSSISWIVHWVDILTAGQLSAGTTPRSGHPVPTSPRAYNLTNGFSLPIPDANDPRSLGEEYARVYGEFFREAYARRNHFRQHPESSLPTDRIPFERYFQRGTLIGRFLSDPTRGKGVGRIVALLYLNLVLLDYRTCPLHITHSYFNRLRHAMVDQGLDLGGSLELFLWILITNLETHNVESPERMWIVARLLRVHDRLCYDTQLRLEEALLQLLSGEDGDIFEPVYTPEQFCLEIMQEVDSSFKARSCD